MDIKDLYLKLSRSPDGLMGWQILQYRALELLKEALATF